MFLRCLLIAGTFTPNSSARLRWGSHTDSLNTTTVTRTAPFGAV